MAWVRCQVNGAGWTLASTTNGWSNWWLTASLVSGANLVQAFASDPNNNRSLTNSVKFTSSFTQDWAPASLGGLQSCWIPESAGASQESAAFGNGSFTQVPTNAWDASPAAVGSFNYTKLSTNLARLTRTFTGPNLAGEVFVRDLVFTHVNRGRFTVPGGGGGAGSFEFSRATNQVPWSVFGKTLSLALTEPNGISLGVFSSIALAGSAFTQSDLFGNVATGSFTFTPLSPLGARLTLTYATPPNLEGSVKHIDLTFSSSTAGKYFSSGLDGACGTFTLP